MTSRKRRVEVYLEALGLKLEVFWAFWFLLYGLWGLITTNAISGVPFSLIIVQRAPKPYSNR